MSATLYSYAKALPELGGRVYLDVAPSTPQTPYGIVYDVEGGITTPLYGNSDISAVYPSITVYHKPGAGQTSQDARLALTGIMNKLLQAHRSIDTHSDGVTPFRGSVRRASDYAVKPDSTVPGQYFATLRFHAEYARE